MKSAYEGLALKKLSGNIILNIIRQGFGIIIGLGLSILLARSLGPTGNGQYAMGILLPSMFATFLSLGISPANVYFIASKKVNLFSAFKANIFLWLVLSALGILLSVFVIETKSNALFPGISLSFIWLGILAFPFLILGDFLGGIFQGLQDFKKYSFVSAMFPAMILLFTILLVGVLKLGVFGALLSFILGNLFGILIALILLKPSIQKASGKYEKGELKKYVKECLDYGWKSHLSNILTFVNYRSDIFFVNLLLTPDATGIYVLAVSIAEKLWILSRSVSMVILPRLSELNEDEEKRKQLTPLITRWVLLISSIGTLIFALVASPLINLLYGIEFHSAVGALLLLLPGILIGNMSKILSNDIASRGKPELNFYVSVLVVFVNVVFDIVLIPMLGIKGAAIATTIAYGVDAIAKLWLYSYLSKIPWWRTIVFSTSDKLLLQKSLSTAKNRLYK